MLGAPGDDLCYECAYPALAKASEGGLGVRLAS